MKDEWKFKSKRSPWGCFLKYCAAILALCTSLACQAQSGIMNNKIILDEVTRVEYFTGFGGFFFFNPSEGMLRDSGCKFVISDPATIKSFTQMLGGIHFEPRQGGMYGNINGMIYLYYKGGILAYLYAYGFEMEKVPGVFYRVDSDAPAKDREYLNVPSAEGFFVDVALARKTRDFIIQNQKNIEGYEGSGCGGYGGVKLNKREK
jgi:hypothetical protein